MDVDVHCSKGLFCIKKHGCAPEGKDKLLGTVPLITKLYQKHRKKLDGCQKVCLESVRDKELLDHLKTFPLIVDKCP